MVAATWACAGSSPSQEARSGAAGVVAPRTGSPAAESGSGSSEMIPAAGGVARGEPGAPEVAAAEPPAPEPAPEPAPDVEPEVGPEAEPTYDLEADLARREEIARDSLGDRVRLARVEGVFLVVGDRSMSKGRFESAATLIRKTVAAYLNDRFATLPARAVDIYLFARKKPYEAYCDEYYDGCGTPYGVYYQSDRRIVMNIGPGPGTLTHELVHPIVEADFPDAPTWIDEGIASLFERPRFPAAGQIRGIKNWRHPRLLQALRSRRERDRAAMDRLFGMSNREFRGDLEDLHYAMARYVCQWLDEEGFLWRFYQEWRDHYDDDPTGVRAFTRVVGKTPAEAAPEWADWVKRL